MLDGRKTANLSSAKSIDSAIANLSGRKIYQIFICQGTACKNFIRSTFAKYYPKYNIDLSLFTHSD
jgi:hypothetical protein